MNKSNIKIILITIDSLRMSSDVANRLASISSKLGLNYMLFSSAYSNGPGTNQSFPSIMSSTPFLVHGGLKLRPGIPSLAEVLSKGGFYTVGFHSNPFLSRRFGWNRGFREFYDFLGKYRSPAGFVVSSSGWRRLVVDIMGKLLKGNSRRLWSLANKLYYKLKGFNLPYIEARELNNYVLKWAKSSRGKFNSLFLWIHYMDVHFPYAPPDEYLSEAGFSSRSEAFFYNYELDFEDPNPKIVEKLKKLYKASVRYVFDNIDYLLEELGRLGYLENSLIVVTSDHGEAFLEHGKFGHAYDILYNEVLRVPLVISGNIVTPNKQTYDRPVQLMDIAPTIIDLIGVKRPPTFRGRSLAMLLRGEVDELDIYPIFSESAVPDLINLKYDTSRYIVSVVLGKWKLIMDRIYSRSPRFELYDLKADPSEKRNLLKEYEDVAESLKELIDSHLKDVARLRKLGETMVSIRSKLRRIRVM